MVRREGVVRLLSVAGFLRPQIALQASAYVFVGAYLSGAGPGLLSAPTLTAALAVALIVSFGFVINDYADRELDRFQKPERPLPAGVVTVSEAWLLGGAMIAGALSVAVFLDALLRAMVYLNLLLAAAYSLWLKRTVLLGNLVIAALNSSVIIFGGLAGAGLSPLVWSIAGTTFFFSLAQEVLYTVGDRPGDEQAGIATAAIYFGDDVALVLFRTLIVVAALSSLVPIWLGAGSPVYVLLLLPCTIGPIALRLIPLTLRGDSAAIEAAVRAIKNVRASSLLPLLFLRPFPW